MAVKLQRSFPSREHFAETFVRRLSDRGIELRLTGQVAPPTGTVLDLDLRLDDGAPLIVGTGEVTSGGRNADRFRVRFLELTEATRAGLDRLVLLVAAASDETPTQLLAKDAPGATRTANDERGSIRDLVEGVYGETRGRSSLENSAVLVPPDPATKSAQTGAKGASARSGRGPGGRRSLSQRFQISPAVIIVAIIAGATGAAANAWFQDLAGFLSVLTSADEDLSKPPTVDFMPTGVVPSDFSGEGADAEASTQGDDGSVPVSIAGDLVTEQGDGGAPILSGAAGEGGAAGLSGDEVARASGPDARPADRVRLITWDEYPEETVVTFHGNGPFLADRVLRLRVRGGKPRELIKIRGIDLPFRDTLIETATPELERIRTGFHPQSQVNELHAVLDLAGPNVELDRVELGDNTLALHLRTVTPTSDGADGDATAAPIPGQTAE